MATNRSIAPGEGGHEHSSATQPGGAATGLAKSSPFPPAHRKARAERGSRGREASGLVSRTLGRSEDLIQGQIVLVTARWILIVAGLALVLWHPGPIGELRLEVLVLLLLAVPNFYLHALVLMRRPAIDLVVYLASAADLAIVTLLVASQGGFKSNIFVFYFPALLGLSVAFPLGMTVLYGGGVVVLYGLIASATATPTSDNYQAIVTRLLMLAAVATCGCIYLHIERNRRRAATEEHNRLRAELRARATHPSAA